MKNVSEADFTQHEGYFRQAIAAQDTTHLNASDVDITSVSGGTRRRLGTTGSPSPLTVIYNITLVTTSKSEAQSLYNQVSATLQTSASSGDLANSFISIAQAHGSHAFDNATVTSLAQAQPRITSSATSTGGGGGGGGGGSSFPIGAIIGIVIAGAIILVVAGWAINRRRRIKNKAQSPWVQMKSIS